MPVSLTLKNIPDGLYHQLKTSAAANRRSINMEAIVLLQKTLATERPDVEEQIARIRKLHESMPRLWATPEDIDAFKKEGRK